VPEDPACQALVTGTLSASPIAATTGVAMATPVTLYWDVHLPTTCTASGPITLGDRALIGTSGSMVVSPLASRSYPLQVGSRQVANLTIKTILPSQVHITANTAEQRALFKQAVETRNHTVLLKHDLELDLSVYQETGLHVASGVTIASEAPPVGVALTVPVEGGVEHPYTIARDASHLGPKVYTSAANRVLFYIDGYDDDNRDENDINSSSNIVLRGFRIIGPDMVMNDHMTRGIVISSRKGVEIDRLEVAGFGHAGIYVNDPDQRNNTFPDVNIHDCFFHHNQHVPGGNGYGVVTGLGGMALVRHNVFDYNRHAIASSGEPDTGYWADENLVLKGGGYHEGLAGVVWYTHSFDVHGMDTCTSEFDCGPAADLFLITKNTFQYSRGLNFKLRGTPSRGAYVTDNIFPHSDSRDSFIQNETGMHFANNTQGKQTFGKYGVCDFDGDGLDDLFLATGRTWWFASGGKFHWTYLNSQTEELGQLGLGDFNHDGRCDVMRERNNTWELSSGGTAPYAALPAGFSGPMSQLRFADFNGDGRNDVFQRVPGGQWYVYLSFTSASPIALNSSNGQIEDLRFGDIDGDHITDVLGISGGVWSWSKSGIDPWIAINARYGNFNDVLMIGNVDGVKGDDMIRIANVSLTGGELQVSSGGRGAWTHLVDVTWQSYTPPSGIPSVYEPVLLAGRFNSAIIGTASVLQIDGKERFTTQFSAGQPLFLPRSLYAM